MALAVDRSTHWVKCRMWVLARCILLSSMNSLYTYIYLFIFCIPPHCHFVFNKLSSFPPGGGEGRVFIKVIKNMMEILHIKKNCFASFAVHRLATITTKWQISAVCFSLFYVIMFLFFKKKINSYMYTVSLFSAPGKLPSFSVA